MATLIAVREGMGQWDLSPGPVIRFAHCRLRLCLRGKGSSVPLMAIAMGPIPPAPFPTRKGGAHGFLTVVSLAVLMAWREGTYPPAPFLKGKGSKGLLMAYIKGCFDGVGRGHKAIKNPSSIPSQNRSPFPLVFWKKGLI